MEEKFTEKPTTTSSHYLSSKLNTYNLGLLRFFLGGGVDEISIAPHVFKIETEHNYAYFY